MPYSSTEGKDLIKEFFSKKDIRSVLDIGPGAGTYYDLLAPQFVAEWKAIEVWAPYIQQFGLERKYHEVIVADVRYFDWDSLREPIDLIILGDILEHMPYGAAYSLITKVNNKSRYFVVSLPIIHYPQGAEMGNPWETHVEHYDKERVKQLLTHMEVLASFEGEVTGTYILAGDWCND